MLPGNVPTLFVGNVGSATPAANTLNVLGSTGILVTGSGDTLTISLSGVGPSVQTLTGNSGGAVSPIANNINVVGTGSITIIGTPLTSTLTAELTGLTTNAILYGQGTPTLGQVTPAANSVLTTNASDVPTLIALTDGQIVIGSSIGAPLAATITAGAGISIVNGNNSITIAVSGSTVGETITGNSGGALSPTAGNWNIFGASTAAGTSPVTISGSVSTLTVNVQRSQAIASANATNVGLAAFNSAQFTVDPNGFVSAASSGLVITLTGNSGTATPSSNNINVVTANTTVKFVGSVATLTEDFGLSNLLLGSSGSAITSATHTASVGDTALTAITSGGSNSALGYAAGSGITTGASNTLLGASAGSNYTSSESNNIIIGAGVPGTAAESNVIRMGQSASTGFQLTGMNSLFFHNFGSNNLFIGISAGNQTLSGANNLGLGLDALNALTSGGSNVALGRSSLSALTSGGTNVAVGVNSLLTISTNSNCVAVGYQTLKLATGGNNTAVGTNSLSAVTSGTGNTCVGYTAGQNYTGTESNNICIGNGVLGTATETTTTRIGNAQTACYITGIDGVNVGSVAKVVTEASNQLGTATITAGAGVTVTPTANTITIAANTQTAVLTFTVVTHASSPYTVLSTDQFLEVDTTGGAVTINLPNAPTTGRIIYIKDYKGNAATTNILVTTVGGSVTIDGQTTYTMAANYTGLILTFDGTGYFIV
jgi:hypothetical protein